MIGETCPMRSTRSLRARLLAASVGGVLLLAACGGGGDGGDSAGGATADGVTADGATADGEAESAEADVFTTAGVDLGGVEVDPASEMETNLFPDLVVDDIGRGKKVNIRNIVPSDKPVLLWMWAPH